VIEIPPGRSSNLDQLEGTFCSRVEEVELEVDVLVFEDGAVMTAIWLSSRSR